LIPRHHSRRLDGSAFGELRYCCEGELCMRRFSDGLTTAGNKSRQHRSGFSACFSSSSSSSPAGDFVFLFCINVFALHSHYVSALL